MPGQEAQGIAMAKSRSTYATETDLAKAVAQWMGDQGWDLYFEVDHGKRADIVGRKGRYLWVVETKLNCGFELVSQAIWWVHEAHLVSIAYPQRCGYRASKTWPAIHAALSYHGIGTVEANEYSIREGLAPAFRRKVNSDRLLNCLNERQKVYAEPGNATGRRWTPFQDTCDQIRELLRDRAAGMPLKEVIDTVKHHYATPASARSSLFKWITEEKVPGVEIRDVRGKCFVFATEAGADRSAGRTKAARAAGA